MPKFDMAYSLNKTAVIEADTVEDAEALLNEKLKSKNIDTKDDFVLDIYDIQDIDPLDTDTYKVTVELEVTAENKQQAIDFALDDIKELSKNNTLEPTVELLD